MKLVILATIAIFLAPATVSAQTTAFSYQGSLNTAGAPANGNHDFEFALFDSLAAGTQLGSTLTRTNVVVTNGVFAVTLDFGNQFPGQGRFLEIRVRTAGSGAFTTLVPRQPVNSTPYSVKSLSSDNAASATNASQLGGVAANQYVVTGDPRMSDARQPLAGSVNYIQNGTSLQAAANFNISGNGTSAGTLSGDTVNATTQYNFGGNRVLSAAGTSNLFAGVNAGQANTTGERNAFFGANAGDSNTTGGRNTFVGAGAGSSNTTGGSNTFVGENAGRSNTTAIINSFFGHDAGQANTTGFANAFFGTRAGRLNTTGTANSFFGAEAGSANNSGGSNAFFGYQAGRGNTDGGNNSFFGRAAGELTTGGGDNSFYGHASGQATTTGNGNSFFGANAGDSNITGGNNTIIGRNADVGSDILTNATAIGNRAFVAQNNSLVLGSINGVNGAAADTNVGIGTTAPTQKLHVVGNGLFSSNLTAATVNATTQFNFNGSRMIGAPGTSNLFVGFESGLSNTTGSANSFFASGSGHDNSSGTDNSFFGVNTGRANTSGNRNTYFGRLAGRFNTTGDDNTALGYNAGSGNLSGSDNTIIGANADVATGALVNATAIGFRALVSASNSLVLGSINGVNGSTVNTRVGIGTTAPINRLTIGDPETPVLNGAVGIFNAGGTFLTVRDTTNNIEGFVGADANGVLFGSLTDSIVRIRTNNSNRLTFDGIGNAIFSGIVSMNSFLALDTLDSGGATALCRGPANRVSTCGSSLRYKSNVSTFASGLELIKRLRPVSFDWKNGGVHDLGLVAEEVAAVEPLLTTTNKNGEVEGVKYDRVGVVLVNAVREQQVEIEAQARKIRDQETVITSQTKTIESQQAQIDGLKKAVCSLFPSAEICKTKE